MLQHLYAENLDNPSVFLLGIQSIAQGENLILEFCHHDLSSELIAWHKKTYPWHHADTIRSYTQKQLRKHGNHGKREDFAYMNRAAKYFGYDQFVEHRAQPNKLMCLWDPSLAGDILGEHNPCLVLVRFQKDGKFLNLTAVYRKRDLLRRMIGNLAMLVVWLKKEAERRKLQPGLITDFSMSTQYDEKKLLQHIREEK